MKDSTRENLSYFELFYRISQVKKVTTPEKFIYGTHRDQYGLYYEPREVKSDKVFVWVHGGGWNSGTPKMYDCIGQRVAAAGYRMLSIGYRLAPNHKYEEQIKDVCKGYNAGIKFLEDKGIDTSKLILSGSSAGAHLSAILCYSKATQLQYDVDLSGVIGYIGNGGPYSFSVELTKSVKQMLNMLFEKDYDRKKGEPVSLMEKSDIPMLIIQSEHDGLVTYEGGVEFCKKAEELGIPCELYSVTDRHDTHSWYCAGSFLLERDECETIDKFYSWMENIGDDKRNK